MPRLREATRLERRRTFVRAAWRRAATQGYRDMTVDDVCAEAGLSKGAFYVHFPSKRSLLYALIEDDAATIGEILEQLEAGPLDPVERIRTLSRRMLERARDQSRVQVLADLWAAVPTEPEVRDRLRLAVQQHRKVIRGWVEEGIANGEMVDIPPNALASILLALNDGLMLHRVLEEGGFRWANVSRTLDLLLAGLRAS